MGGMVRQVLMMLLWSVLVIPLPTDAAVKLNVSIVAAGSINRTLFSSFVYLAAPLTVAVEHVNQKYGETINFTLTTLYSSTRTEWSQFAEDLEWMVSEWHYKKRNEHDLTVYISPSFPPTTRLPYFQQQWNNLFITTMTASPDIRNRTLNPTWIATNFFVTTTCAQLYVGTFLKYNWTSTYLVVDNSSDPFYKTVALIVADELKKIGVKLVWNEIATKNSHPFRDFVPILQQARTTCRVILFYAHASYLREFLLLAATMNMTNGEYVYIAPQSMRNNPRQLGLLDWQYNDTNDQIAFLAYQSVLVIHPRNMDKPPNKYLAPRFLEQSQILHNFSYPLAEQPFYVLTDTYNAVAAVGKVINETLSRAEGFNYKNGTALAELLLNRTFSDDGGAGEIYIDNYGMRRTDFTLSYFTPNGTREPLMHKIGMTGALEEVIRLETWVNVSFPPPNEPVCGYLHQRDICQPKRDKTLTYIIIAALAGALLFTGSGAIGCVRHIRRKAEERLLLSPWWHVTLMPVSSMASKKSGQSSFFSGMSRKRLDSVSVDTKYTAALKTGSYEGKPVMIRSICCRNYPATFRHLSAHHGFLQIMKKSRASKSVPIFRINNYRYGYLSISTVFERPLRGSFLDVCNSFITKDFGFASSLIVDYLDAVEFVHACPFRYHARISILACWVDRHFTLKIANLAVDRLTEELCRTSEHFKECSQPTVVESLYWLTPETPDPSNLKGMQAVDIFSTGFIIYEILTKASLHAKIRSNKAEELADYNILRDAHPFLQSVDFANLREFERLLRSCWNADPVLRPSIRRLRADIGDISPMLVAGSRRRNIVEKMYIRLSGYSADLEREVAVRTIALKEEMDKCDAITGQFLPRAVVKQMRAGLNVAAELFDCVTLMFTDLVGFADYVKTSSPELTISLIGDTEAWFDTLSTKCEVYKVEAIGDSYLVASGLPERNEGDHVRRIANFAVRLMEAESNLTFLKDLRFKVGIHSGPCAAGVLKVLLGWSDNRAPDIAAARRLLHRSIVGGPAL